MISAVFILKVSTLPLWNKLWLFEYCIHCSRLVINDDCYKWSVITQSSADVPSSCLTETMSVSVGSIDEPSDARCAWSCTYHETRRWHHVITLMMNIHQIALNPFNAQIFFLFLQKSCKPSPYTSKDDRILLNRYPLNAYNIALPELMPTARLCYSCEPTSLDDSSFDHCTKISLSLQDSTSYINISTQAGNIL